MGSRPPRPEHGANPAPALATGAGAPAARRRRAGGASAARKFGPAAPEHPQRRQRVSFAPLWVVGRYASEAIKRSTEYDEIVYIQHDNATERDLICACDEYAESNDLTEFWGVTDAKTANVCDVFHYECNPVGVQFFRGVPWQHIRAKRDCWHDYFLWC
jgi:hypothetical protein